MPGADFVRFNDVADLEAKFDPGVCAIVLETIQGEGGIYPVSEAFWNRARELATREPCRIDCRRNSVRARARTGRAFAYQKFASLPDIVAVAKPLAAGLPFGAVIANEEFAQRSCARPAWDDVRRRAADLRDGARGAAKSSKTKS